MMLCSSMFSQTTFDFDANANELFGITGSSSGTNDTYVPDGEFKEDKTATIDGISVTVTASAEDATTPNRIWATAPRLRLYNGTFTVKGTNITRIEFTGHNKNFNISTETGTLSGKTWTGEANEIVFTVNKNTQLNKIVVYTGDSGQGGGDPEFTGPTVDNIAAFKALENNTEAKLMLNNAVVLYAKGSDIFVRDNTGAIDFYETGLKLTAGQVLNGFVIGKYTLFRNLPELAKNDFTNADGFTTSEGTATPKNIGLDEVGGFVCDLVSIQGVSIAKENDGNYYASTGDGKVQIYDKFKLGYEANIDETKTYDITCIVVAYNDIIEICPTEDFTAGTVDPYTFVGDGSRENPYTVEDVKHMAIPESTTATEGQQKVWVKGYIVGALNTSGNKYVEGENIVDTNLGLGATTNEPEASATVPVQLPKGNIRDALNVKDTPDNVGKELLVYGYILKYMNKTGVKEVSDYVLDGVTGISNLNVENAGNGQLFNVAGQRVSGSYKGIVIANGKKFVVK